MPSMSRAVTLFVNDVLPPAGTERAAVNLANTLTRHGYSVEIVSLFSAAGQPFYDLEQGVRVTHGGLRLRGHAAERFARVVSVVSGLARQRPGRTLIGTNHAINIALGLLKLRSRGWRCIGCEHTGYHAATPYVKPIRRLVYPLLDKVVVLTQADQLSYRKLDGASNSVIIPNESPFPGGVLADYRSKRLLAIGRLIPRKGFDLLIDDVAGVLRRFRDWSLTIVGEGEMEEPLRAQIARHGLEEQISILPPTHDVEAHYQGSSVYLLSSRAEGLPMVLIEAKTFGLPTVAYDCPTGPREVVTPQDGFLIPMGDRAGYAAAVTLLVENQALRESMGRAAAEDARRFASEEVFKLWKTVLQE